MDEVFGAGHFLNEIVWCYQGTGKTVTQYKRKHDTLLFYAKTDCWTFNARAVGTPFGEKQRKKFSGRDERGAYKEYRHADGRVYRKYWQEDDFLPCNDWWSDIFVIQDHGERVGYPTQKPEALLNRIITASSRPGDLVFDCFMGSGTAQAAAMKLGRRFLGADSSLGAVQTAVKRLLAAGEGLEAEEGTWYTGFAVYTVGDPVQKGEKGAADIVCEGGRLVVRRFYPARLMRELALRGACPEDWRRLVDSIMIDWNYDGTVLRPSVTDIPRKNEMVSGSYRIPETTGVIRVKITDLLSESLEIEVC